MYIYIYILWYLLMSTIPRIWSFGSHCSGEVGTSRLQTRLAQGSTASARRRQGVQIFRSRFGRGLQQCHVYGMPGMSDFTADLRGFYGNLWGLNMSEWDLTWSKKLLSGFIMFYGVLMGCCVLRRVLTMSNTWKYSLRNSPVDGLMYRTMNWRVSVGDYELSVTNPYDN